MPNVIDGIETTGLNEFMQRILKLDDDAKPAIEKALTIGGKILKAAVVPNIPKSLEPRQPDGKRNNWRSGEHARDGIHQSRVLEKAGKKYVLVGISKASSTKWWYLKLYEYGFHRKKDGSWYAVPGLHMFARAVAETENKIINEMSSVLKKELNLE